MPLKILVQQFVPGVICFRLEGELDADGYQELEAAFDKCFHDCRYRYILELSQLTRITSPGAGVLLNAASICQDHGGAIVLVGPRLEVKDILDLLGFPQILAAAANREQALAKF